MYLGLHGELRPGLRGGSAGLGLVLMPRFLMPSPFPLPGLEVAVRYLKPWRRSLPESDLFGPEFTLYLMNLRASVSALAPDVGAGFRGRRWLVWVGGFGYL